MKAPPKVSRPGLQPLPEDRRVQRDRHRSREDDEDGRSERERVRAPSPAPGVRPQLVGEPSTEQDQDEVRVSEQRQGEARDRDQRQRDVRDEGAAEADDRPRDDRADRRCQAVEELVEMPGQVRLDVEDRQGQHQDEAGQHEAEAGEEAAELAAAEASEVDAELVRLGTGEDLKDGEGLLEALLGDPSLLVDALVLDHRDLRRRAAPCQARRTSGSEGRSRKEHPSICPELRWPQPRRWAAVLLIETRAADTG